MIPLAVPDLSGNEARYLQECVDSTYVSSVGPFVERFEEITAAACGTEDAVATASGTAALHLALTAVGVGRDDLVLMPALTFIAPANAVSYTGARPLFLDSARESWTLDPIALQLFLQNDCELSASGPIHRASGQRLAAILTVHTLGHPSDMGRLSAIANEWRLPLVADAAAAIGAEYRDRSAIAQATLSAVSFNGNKTVTCGGGGLVTGADRNLLQRIRHLSTTARVGTNYDHDDIGFNYRMTNLQAAVGCAQMERLETLLAAKRRIADRYDAAFAGIEGLSPFPRAPWGQSAFWYCGTLIGDESSNTADELIAALNESGIGARQFWKPMHRQTPYRDNPRGPLAVTDDLWHRIVTLPCSSGLTETDQSFVIDTVRAAFAERKCAPARLRN
jgi:dTDP-4-amino-4,6-dideoxygalactose transaminase